MRNSKGQFLKGYHPSTEFKKGCRVWNKDINIQCNTGRTHFLKGQFAGKNNYNFGRNMSGEKSPSWKGGVTQDRKYQSLKLKGWRDKRGKQYIQFCNHKRRILTENLTLEIIQQVYEDNIKRYGTLACYLCLQPIPFGKDHLEHKIPLSRNGTNIRENLDIACQKCNCKKHAKTEEEYRRQI